MRAAEFDKEMDEGVIRFAGHLAKDAVTGTAKAAGRALHAQRLKMARSEKGGAKAVGRWTDALGRDWNQYKGATGVGLDFQSVTRFVLDTYGRAYGITPDNILKILKTHNPGMNFPTQINELNDNNQQFAAGAAGGGGNPPPGSAAPAPEGDPPRGNNQSNDSEKKPEGAPFTEKNLDDFLTAIARYFVSNPKIRMAAAFYHPHSQKYRDMIAGVDTQREPEDGEKVVAKKREEDEREDEDANQSQRAMWLEQLGLDRETISSLRRMTFESGRVAKVLFDSVQSYDFKDKKNNILAFLMLCHKHRKKNVDKKKLAAWTADIGFDKGAFSRVYDNSVKTAAEAVDILNNFNRMPIDQNDADRFITLLLLMYQYGDVFERL
jgi:hypothetical protein